jgi:hypothetical protein
MDKTYKLIDPDDPERCRVITINDDNQVTELKEITEDKELHEINKDKE